MKDPYVILGVSRNASDEEVKKAYRDLARKYHPDNYVNNPLADLAQEKMKEINEAYDTITKARESGGSAQAQYAGYSSGRSGHSSGPYKDARDAISAGDLNRAEMILGSITQRGAEWYFLMGSLSYRKGWLDEARRNARFLRRQQQLYKEEETEEPGYAQAETYLLLSKLSPEMQTLFRLRYFEGYSAAELGELFHMPPATVRTKLSRARQILRKELFI